MNCLSRRLIIPINMCRYLKHDLLERPFHSVVSKNTNITSILVNFPSNSFYDFYRHKSKKHRETDSDDEDVGYSDDLSLSRDSKVVKFNTTSMRTDIILKSALNVARNKIEQVFYESKIRVNGKKILKKSTSVKLGDEIDVIKSVSPKNPDHLNISRVEILNVTVQEDKITVTARRFKSLLIENYETAPYKAGSAETEN